MIKSGVIVHAETNRETGKIFYNTRPHFPLN